MAKKIILHFVGICGAGKSTLCHNLEQKFQEHQINMMKTIDYDPNIPDHERINERAFNRKLDLLNNQHYGKNLFIQEQIIEHCLSTIKFWQQNDTKIVLVDRWYESYDYLSQKHIDSIEAAIQSSDFHLIHVFLKVSNDINSNDSNTIKQRILHTKNTRPLSWFNSVPNIEQWGFNS